MSGSSDWRFVLATDLDGTFLGGSEDDRLALYRWIEARRDDVGLIFVTGRDPRFIADLCDDTPVPWPDFVVGDVGTTIAEVTDGQGEERIAFMLDLEKHIAMQWDDAGDRVREALSDAPGLTEQETEFRHRLSFDYDPQTYHPAARQKIEEMGFDVIISDDRFFDVLPKGVSKGPSLLRLIDHLGMDRDRVLVAGDTMNDLSMFRTGLHGAVVGGAEKPLLEATNGIEKVRQCDRIGAGGIAEAIMAFSLHPVPIEVK
ncbi:HAD-IIB family hydrolase [Notoacmeibacter ruber]|uniref:HAD-IIB family hydrolase n=1 Tax=Notoacmeibacter ruber TaxID=2670375 RepID=A0A3L7J995_9HYPH|nr:HAD-IIB family hydrolase [Notoacmeibacter ruber]RLQ87253.1 HAD-IIB family hydrolase [Notoacmeibacter ruber]